MIRVEILLSAPSSEVDVLAIAAAVDFSGDHLPPFVIHEVHVTQEDA